MLNQVLLSKSVPDTIIEYLAQFFSDMDIRQFYLVSKQSKAILDKESFWKNKYHLISPTATRLSVSWKQQYVSLKQTVGEMNAYPKELLGAVGGPLKMALLPDMSSSFCFHGDYFRSVIRFSKTGRGTLYYPEGHQQKFYAVCITGTPVAETYSQHGCNQDTVALMFWSPKGDQDWRIRGPNEGIIPCKNPGYAGIIINETYEWLERLLKNEPCGSWSCDKAEEGPRTQPDGSSTIFLYDSIKEKQKQKKSPKKTEPNSLLVNPKKRKNI